ncbi:MAG TPA: aromatic-ring-hydroxylating dioxygenase subunit beta [Sphingomicrobium sp.]|jgi:3-phenylpropionate/cinnamic acid dioxygenase small subunit|nr:aromatic-ring-hydroxylating dioxygenase subunit beta [Sphingomicrobium sp.]
MERRIDLAAIAKLNHDYARSIDEDDLERWPSFFAETCLYRITTADNHARGFEAGLIYADTRAMLEDRVKSLRIANIYERHRYRHILGMPVLGEVSGSGTCCETSFVVIRIMRDGTLTVFATGKYLDRVTVEDSERLVFSERIVVCDNANIDAMLALPL